MSVASDAAARCPTCEGAYLHRLVSRVAVLKSEDSRGRDGGPINDGGQESEDPQDWPLYAPDEQRKWANR